MAVLPKVPPEVPELPEVSGLQHAFVDGELLVAQGGAGLN